MKDFKDIVASGGYFYSFTLTSPGQLYTIISLNTFISCLHHKLFFAFL